MLLHLAALTAAVVVRDLTLPFPRPSASEAIARLAEAVKEQESAGAPADMLDAYGGRSEWLAEFEGEIAAHLGKERAMFFPTGVAAQNAALAVHAALPFRDHRMQPPPCFMLHDTSHLQRYEDLAYKELLGVNALIAGEAHRVLSASDIEVHLQRLVAVGSGPCMILVELPHRELGCETVPWEELVEMRRLADRYDVPLHLDGARLWEIAPYYMETAGKSISEIVALFDSAYVSFYKGLGALTGAMLLGSAKFVEAARPWRRRLGANPYTSMPYALSCRDAFRRHAHTFEARWRKLAHIVPLISEAAAAEGATFRTIPEQPQSCQVHACIGLLAGTADEAAMDAARDLVDEELGMRVYGRLIGSGGVYGSGGGGAGRSERAEGRFEWCLGPAHVKMDDEDFIRAWRAFFRALKASEGSP